MSERLPNYPFRMDPKMRIDAGERAKAERRSLNSWLQIAVEEKLERCREQEKVA